MRIADLLSSTVVGADDDEIGRVADVWLTQDGPPVGAFGAALRVDAVVIGRFGLASRAGYDRANVDGPAPIAWFLRRRTSHRPVAAWSDIAAIQEGRINLSRGGPDLDRPRSIEQPSTGRRWSAGLELLDRQLVDPDGRMAGKVDDLELEPRQDGPPIVTAVLAGPGALARRIGGKPGEWLASVHARLSGDAGDPARISFGVVARIDDHLTLTVSRDDVATHAVEAWVRDRVIARIPGS